MGEMGVAEVVMDRSNNFRGIKYPFLALVRMVCTLWGGSIGTLRGGRRGSSGVEGGGLGWWSGAAKELVGNGGNVSRVLGAAVEGDAVGTDPEGDPGAWMMRIPEWMRARFSVARGGSCEGACGVGALYGEIDHQK
jgi:hypothetical protein